MNKTFTDKNAPFKFVLENEPFKNKSYIAIYTFVCVNPLCECTDITFFIKEIDETDNVIEPDRIDYNYTIDIFKRKVSKHWIDRINPESMVFANHFISELTNDSWEFFANCFFDHKRKLLSDSKIIDSLLADFSENEYSIEKENFMIGFAGVFPNVESMIFKYDDIDYLIDDQYCLASSCNCTNTGLNIIALLEKNEKKHDRMVAVYDYKKDTWDINYNFKIIQHTDKEIIKQVEFFFPDIRKIFKQRHRILRHLYANYRKRKEESDPIPASEQKVGRNEPCPCGSGKKYKHCCG